jgi:hypothetical protein
LQQKDDTQEVEEEEDDDESQFTDKNSQGMAGSPGTNRNVLVHVNEISQNRNQIKSKLLG